MNLKLTYIIWKAAIVFKYYNTFLPKKGLRISGLFTLISIIVEFILPVEWSKAIISCFSVHMDTWGLFWL